MKKNKMSMRVAEKCGYYKEGVQRGKRYMHGEYVDAYSYAELLRKNAKKWLSPESLMRRRLSVK